MHTVVQRDVEELIVQQAGITLIVEAYERGCTRNRNRLTGHVRDRSASANIKASCVNCAQCDRILVDHSDRLPSGVDEKPVDRIWRTGCQPIEIVIDGIRIQDIDGACIAILVQIDRTRGRQRSRVSDFDAGPFQIDAKCSGTIGISTHENRSARKPCNQLCDRPARVDRKCSCRGRRVRFTKACRYKAQLDVVCVAQDNRS